MKKSLLASALFIVSASSVMASDNYFRPRNKFFTVEMVNPNSRYSHTDTVPRVINVDQIMHIHEDGYIYLNGNVTIQVKDKTGAQIRTMIYTQEALTETD